MEAADTILSQSSLFKLLDPAELQDLSRGLERSKYEAGQKVFSFGEPGDSLYVVIQGRIELFVKDTTGSKIVLTVCEPGEVFGELSLFDGGSRTASAIALDEAELFILGRTELLSFLRQHPDAALDLLATMGQRIRSTDEILRHRVARNINEEMEMKSTLFGKVSDLISEFSGSLPFLIMNGVWFVTWIVWNLIPGIHHFDPYPFGFLTMTVSLEAIFLSIFVLISQNRQAAKDRLRADAEYEVNLKAELEVSHLHEKVDFLTEELLARMQRPPKATLRETR